MRISRILFFTIKQTIKRPVIWFLLLIMPIICFTIRTISFGNENTSITALFYIDKDDNKPIYDALINYDGLVSFKFIDDEDTLRTKIKLSKAECGYIFKDDALDRLYEGDNDKVIEIVSNKNSTMPLVINEVLYSQLFPIISKHAITEYLSTDGVSKEYYNDLFFEEDVHSLYDKYYNNGSTFHFDYNGAPDNYELTTNEIVIAPMRGLLALFIFISSFAGALQFYKQSENPVFSINKIRLAHIFIPTLLTAISSYISLIISKSILNKYMMEGLILLAYVVAVTAFTFIITKVIRKSTALGWLLPFIILGSIIFTPVIIDISTFIPVVKYISFLFPTKYYLMLIAII